MWPGRAPGLLLTIDSQRNASHKAEFESLRGQLLQQGQGNQLQEIREGFRDMQRTVLTDMKAIKEMKLSQAVSTGDAGEASDALNWVERDTQYVYKLQPDSAEATKEGCKVQNKPDCCGHGKCIR